MSVSNYLERLLFHRVVGGCGGLTSAMPHIEGGDRRGVEVNRLDVRAVFPFTFQERFKSGPLAETRARRMLGSSLARIRLVRRMIIFLKRGGETTL